MISTYISRRLTFFLSALFFLIILFRVLFSSPIHLGEIVATGTLFFLSLMFQVPHLILHDENSYLLDIHFSINTAVILFLAILIFIEPIYSNITPYFLFSSIILMCISFILGIFIFPSKLSSFFLDPFLNFESNLKESTLEDFDTTIKKLNSELHEIKKNPELQKNYDKNVLGSIHKEIKSVNVFLKDLDKKVKTKAKWENIFFGTIGSLVAASMIYLISIVSGG